MGGSIDEETDKNVSNSNEKCDDDHLNDSQATEYKELIYKLFQFRTYKLVRSNGDFGCPFCDYNEENRQCEFVHLLLHAIQVGEGSGNGKQRANHLAMARYLANDLAREVKAEANHGNGVDILRRDESASTKIVQLESELNEMNDLLTKQHQTCVELQWGYKELITENNNAAGDVLRLERELNDKTVQINDLIMKQRQLEKELNEKAYQINDLITKQRQLDRELNEKTYQISDLITKERQLERELNEKSDQINDLITKERQSNDEMQRARTEIIMMETEALDSVRNLESQFNTLKGVFNELSKNIDLLMKLFVTYFSTIKETEV